MKIATLGSEAQAESGWTKSSVSGGTACCVEVKRHKFAVLVRDSKYRRTPGNDPRSEPVICIDRGQWDAFLKDVTSQRDLVGAAYRVVRETDRSVAVTAGDDRTTLTFTAPEWRAFIEGVAIGDFSEI